MTDISTFESRTGKLSCSADEAFNFAADIRNFERFIPVNSIKNLKLEKDSCSFNIDILGTVKIHISEKVKPVKIMFSGQVTQVKELSLLMNIYETGSNSSETRLIVRAEINPFLKMMAAEPVKRLLETVINEMEKFKGWKETA